jgi:hypothetical protein
MNQKHVSNAVLSYHIHRLKCRGDPLLPVIRIAVQRAA